MPTDPFTCKGKYSEIVNYMTKLAKNGNLSLQEKIFIICKKTLMYSGRKKRISKFMPIQKQIHSQKFQNNVTQRNETARIPKNPLGSLYTSVSTLCLFTKFLLITLRLPRHQPLAIAYSEIFKFGSLPIIPHSPFYTRFPHPALNSNLLTQLWKRNTFHTQKFSEAVLKLLSPQQLHLVPQNLAELLDGTSVQTVELKKCPSG